MSSSTVVVAVFFFYNCHFCLLHLLLLYDLRWCFVLVPLPPYCWLLLPKLREELFVVGEVYVCIPWCFLCWVWGSLKISLSKFDDRSKSPFLLSLRISKSSILLSLEISKVQPYSRWWRWLFYNLYSSVWFNLDLICFSLQLLHQH